MDFKKYFDGVNNASTRKTYESMYRNYLARFEDKSGVIPVKKEKDINDFIVGLDKSPSTKKSLYSLLINITSDATLKKSWKKHELAYDKQKLKEREIAKKEKGKSLPTKTDLMEYLKLQMKLGEWKSYVINYLLIYYNTRNADLKLQIIFKRNEIEPDKNYLLLRSSDVVYIRGDYKTKNYYGEKQYVIKSRLLHKALNELVQEGTFTLLDGDDDHLSREVKKHTLDGLIESDYNKIIVSSLDLNKDMEKLKRISERRGTTIDMLISAYKVR